MFQTLKAQNTVLGDLEYVVRSSVSASDKGKATRKYAACARCKVKKLKCIIEGDSCEKCMERGVVCSYNGRAGPDNRNAPLADRQSNQRDVPSKGDSDNKALSSPCEGSPQSGPSYGDYTSSSRDDNEMDTCPTLNTEDDPCSNFLESTFANSFMDDPTHWSTLTQDVHVAHLACLSNETMSGDELPKLDVCFCVDLIIAAHATMQVKLVWVTSLSGCTSSSIDDMLQCQKDVLTSCETVLGCMKCSLRSDYVVLVISMCREMVDGVRALMVITSKEHRNSRRLHLSSDTSSQAKLEAGGWRLEDDDEIEIIRHLVQLRIKKLKNLIDQLEHTVLANHVSYVWVVSNLRDRLSDI